MPTTNLYFHSSEKIVATEQLYQQVRAMKCSKVKIWLDESAWHKGIGRDVEIFQSNAHSGKGLFYYEWRVDECSISPIADSGRKALLNRIVDNKEDFAVVCTETRVKNCMVAFADAIQNANLPDKFVKVPWLSTSDAVFDFCAERGVFDFDLEDATKYERLKGYRAETKGAVAYRERKTGNYIYHDTLHRDHYEVFDTHGNHLGEMNLKGNLDRGKADPDKRFLP